MLGVSVVVALVGLAVSYPHQSNLSYAPISEEDREFLRTLPVHRGGYPAGFQEAYVGRDGTLRHGSRPSGDYIQVIGSPRTPVAAMRRVADDIHRMLKYSPSRIFTNVANHGGGVGIFQRPEKLTLFPVYANLADRPECKGRCDGACKITCTFDGRKWDNIAGATGNLAVIQANNILCDHDPYGERDSVAVHEFAHAVDHTGLDNRMKSMKTKAYNNAKNNSLWRLSTYAMANNAEYFAEATTCFFLVNKMSSPGGMNECYGRYSYCRMETDARNHIRQVDTQLYDLLSYVYTDRRPSLTSGLTICPSSSSVG